MGTRLRNAKKLHKLGGKGKLTDALIKKIQTYYGLAIRRNQDNVDDMKNAIMATYYHLIIVAQQIKIQDTSFVLLEKIAGVSGKG